jgi:ABC-type amino acid transport substrate-binding protein
VNYIPIQYVSIAINNNIAKEYLKIINNSILKLKENGVLINLCKIYIPFNTFLCN